MFRHFSRFSLYIFAGFFLIQSGNPLWGWSFHTHRKITSDALSQMPPAFQKRFGSLKEVFLTGSTDPDTIFKDFQNHVYHLHGGDRMRVSAVHFRDSFDALVDRIRNKSSDAEIARAMGLFSHYIADINQPLHTDGENMDPDEDSYHMKFEKEVDGHLSKISVNFAPFEPVEKPVERMISFAEAANGHYREIGIAYRKGNRLFDLLPMVTVQYNAAVKNVKDYWLGALLKAGEKIELIAPPQAVSAAKTPVPAFLKEEKADADPVLKLDLNSATLEQLMEVPGIGEKKARSILEARPFKSLYDLSKVKGFGIKLIERMSDRVMVK